MGGRLLRMWSYFRRGHGTYLAFLVSLLNFVVIQYRLLIDYVSALKEVFPSLSMFVATFLIIYFPVATFVGWLDYRRLSAPVDTALIFRSNPWARDMAKALILIAEALDPETREKVNALLEKWARGFEEARSGGEDHA